MCHRNYTQEFVVLWFVVVNTLKQRQNGRHFADDTFKRIFLNQNVRNSISISLKFVPKGLIHNITSLVQIMAWRQPGDKPLDYWRISHQFSEHSCDLSTCICQKCFTVRNNDKIASECQWGNPEGYGWNLFCIKAQLSAKLVQNYWDTLYTKIFHTFQSTH